MTLNPTAPPPCHPPSPVAKKQNNNGDTEAPVLERALVCFSCPVCVFIPRWLIWGLAPWSHSSADYTLAPLEDTLGFIQAELV